MVRLPTFTYLNSSILIYTDSEATSSIDVQTDAAIPQTIRESFHNCTVLTIAHRISTIIDYDMIVVMDSGRIVETGAPGDLLAKQHGHFRRLALENGAINAVGGGVVEADIVPASSGF